MDMEVMADIWGIQIMTSPVLSISINQSSGSFPCSYLSHSGTLNIPDI
jgi:hypothetical protein